MAVRQINLDPKILEPFQIGALLLAALAYPKPADFDYIPLVADAWGAQLIFYHAKGEPEPSEELRRAWPDHAAIEPNEIRRRLRQTRRRLRDRMVAAKFARGFLQEATTKRPAILPETMARLSLNELAKLVLRESGQSDPDNVEKRAWRESRPVIHLATAMDHFSDLQNPGVADFGYDLQDLATHRVVVDLARAHEAMVLADSRFGAKPDDLIRFRWID